MKRTQRPIEIKYGTAYITLGGQIAQGLFVSWHKASGKWRAYVMKNGKERHLGLFNDKSEAAEAYNRAASELFQSFARLNEIAG